jgi:hypothetical protein
LNISYKIPFLFAGEMPIKTFSLVEDAIEISCRFLPLFVSFNLGGMLSQFVNTSEDFRFFTCTGSDSCHMCRVADIQIHSEVAVKIGFQFF